MQKLITTVTPKEFRPKINYSDKITLAGSCFAENISTKLIRYKYEVISNPFGILFNPVSIARSFERIANRQAYLEEDLIHHNGRYHSMDHHGSFSGKDKETVLNSINASIERAHLHLTGSQFVFISLGTANVYQYKKTGAIVGNCHKIPQTEFESYRISIEDCASALDKITKSIHTLNAEAHICWTVSPVRYLSEGPEANQLSKATLLLSIDQHLKQQRSGGYFPAYEIMMDQMRDYRFYARDLIHPSPLAIDIIWDSFVSTYLESGHSDTHQSIEKIHRAMEHRFMDDNSDAIRSFAEHQLKSIDQLVKLYPEMDWKEERQYFFQLIEPD